MDFCRLLLPTGDGGWSIPKGVVVLALITAALLIGFGGITDRLIPLFAIGAFLAFTMSQAGMVAHWRREGGKRVAEQRAAELDRGYSARV